MTAALYLVLGTAGSDWEKPLKELMNSLGCDAKNTYIFDPSLNGDVRAGPLGIDVVPAKTVEDIIQVATVDENTKNLIISAGHMYDSALVELIRNFKGNVIVTGRQFDFSGRDFPTITDLLPYAESIEYAGVKCSHKDCTRIATHTQLYVGGMVSFNFSTFADMSFLAKEQKSVCSDHFQRPRSF